MNRVVHQSRRVLLVEDDAWIRTFLHDVLADDGYDVVDAADGRTGLRLVTEKEPDVVLLDLAMPEVTGVDVLHEIRRVPATRDLPVLVLSAFPRVLSPTDTQSVSCVLSKPVNVDELLAQVRHALCAHHK
jgi:DNA-binding response OmpR family regulator